MYAAIRRLQEKRANGEEGFTLIELLVVIIIIGILAAIAIPVFLNQRKKGWDAAATSDLKNAQIVQETLQTDGSFGTLGQLSTEGFKASDGVTFSVISVTSNRYCMSAVSKSPKTFYISSDTSTVPTTAACT